MLHISWAHALLAIYSHHCTYYVPNGFCGLQFSTSSSIFRSMCCYLHFSFLNKPIKQSSIMKLHCRWRGHCLEVSDLYLPAHAFQHETADPHLLLSFGFVDKNATRICEFMNDYIIGFMLQWSILGRSAVWNWSYSPSFNKLPLSPSSGQLMKEIETVSETLNSNSSFTWSRA
jgi:hypothetical protein